MKKAFLFCLLIISGLAVGTYFITHPTAEKTDQSDVAWKEILDNEKPKGIAKAMQHLHELQANQETDEIDLADVYKARQAADALQHQKSACDNDVAPLTWEFLGPNNVGGRTRTLLIDKDDNRRLYAGGVAGGIFISENGGNSWTAYAGNDELPSLSISAIAQTLDGTILVGTGEYFANGVAYGIQSSKSSGNGIYRSTDRGQTFEQITATSIGDFNTNPDAAAWAFVNELATHPSNPDVVYAATRGGVYLSKDKGETWNRVNISGNTWDVKISADGSTVYAAVGGGMYISHDGENFENLNGENNAPTGSTRTKIDVSTNNPDYVYAVTTRNSGCLLQVLQSSDKGMSWDIIGEGHESFFDPMSGGGYCQGWYDLAISVSPHDHERIWVAGITLWSWSATDGWLQLDHYWDSNPDNLYYVHADKHEIVFDKTDPKIAYVLSDGGVARSKSANQQQPTFATVNKNYNVTQFYAVGAGYDGKTMGGTQDNSSPYMDFEGNSQGAARVLRGGDGAYAEISKINPKAIFWSSQNGAMVRSGNNGQGNGNLYFDLNTDANSDGNLDSGPFVTAFFLWEDLNTFLATGEVNTKLFTGGTNGRLWMTRQALNFSTVPEWEQISSQIGGALASIAVTSDGNTVYSLGRNGRITRIQNLDGPETSRTIAKNEPSPFFGRRATGLAIDPVTQNTMVVTAANYGNENYVFIAEGLFFTPFPDLEFESIQHNLPPMPVYDVVVTDNPEYYIIIGTELGMWSYNKNTQCWTEQNEVIGRVPVHRVRMEDMNLVGCKVLYIGTHGNGIHRSTDLVSTFCPEGVTDLPVFNVTNTEEVAQVTTAALSVYPNPMQTQATVTFDLPKASNSVILSMFDVQGRRVQMRDLGQKAAGKHQLKLDRRDLPSGSYFLSLQIETGSINSNLMLID